MLSDITKKINKKGEEGTPEGDGYGVALMVVVVSWVCTSPLGH